MAWVTGVASKRDGRGFVPADFDRDGDLDFLMINSLQPWEYFENRHPSPGNWLVVQLRGRQSNRFGIGARIRVRTGQRWQTRELHAGSGYLSSPPPEGHYGLSDAKLVDEIHIRWPSGKVQVVKDVLVNQVVRIDEDGGVDGVKR